MSRIASCPFAEPFDFREQFGHRRFGFHAAALFEFQISFGNVESLFRLAELLFGKTQALFRLVAFHSLLF